MVIDILLQFGQLRLQKTDGILQRLAYAAGCFSDFRLFLASTFAQQVLLNCRAASQQSLQGSSLRPRRYPGCRPEKGAITSQDQNVKGIGLGPDGQTPAEVFYLGWIDDGHR